MSRTCKRSVPRGYLTEPEAARVLGVTERTLKRWRTQKGCPHEWVRLDGPARRPRILYRRKVVTRWLREKIAAGVIYLPRKRKARRDA